MGNSTSFDLNPEERTRCEVWSRVMGYHRPVSQWNTGKQQEWCDRQHFSEARATADEEYHEDD